MAFSLEHSLVLSSLYALPLVVLPAKDQGLFAKYFYLTLPTESNIYFLALRCEPGPHERLWPKGYWQAWQAEALAWLWSPHAPGKTRR